ncbi:MAG: hydrogenase maturation protease [Chloroflexota bacterium]
MMQVLLIGYGNPLREDDGIGWAAATALSQPEHAVEGVTLITETMHQLLPELADPISQADLVVFVDAAVSGEPGDIQSEAIRPFPSPPGAFSHHVGPAGLLEMARDLYGRFPPAYLFTITVANLGYGENLSPTVTAVLPELLHQIKTVIQTAAESGA